MDDNLIPLPMDDDISIARSEVLDWLQRHGKTEEEIRLRYLEIQHRLAESASEIKELSDRLTSIRKSGPLRSQRLQVVAPDFTCALYVDLVEMLSRNGFVLYCNRCFLPISCDDSPRSNRQRGLQSSGRPVYHPECVKEKGKERKRKYWQKRAQDSQLREAKRLKAQSRRKL